MPVWIKQDHPRFVKFVEMFFEWLSCENDMAIIESIKDIDVTPDGFVKLFKDVFAEGFPDKTVSRVEGLEAEVLVNFMKELLHLVGILAEEQQELHIVIVQLHVRLDMRVVFIMTMNMVHSVD